MRQVTRYRGLLESLAMHTNECVILRGILGSLILCASPCRAWKLPEGRGSRQLHGAGSVPRRQATGDDRRGHHHGVGFCARDHDAIAGGDQQSVVYELDHRTAAFWFGVP